MASTSGVTEAATRSLLKSIRRSLIHCGSMYVNNTGQLQRLMEAGRTTALQLEVDTSRKSAVRPKSPIVGEPQSRCEESVQRGCPIGQHSPWPSLRFLGFGRRKATEAGIGLPALTEILLSQFGL